MNMLYNKLFTLAILLEAVYSAKGPQKPLYLSVAARHARESIVPRCGLKALLRAATTSLSIACTRDCWPGSRPKSCLSSGSVLISLQTDQQTDHTLSSCEV